MCLRHDEKGGGLVWNLMKVEGYLLSIWLIMLVELFYDLRLLIFLLNFILDISLSISGCQVGRFI